MKRDKSSVLIASDLGRCALVFDEDDVVRMLRAAVECEGGQSAFAKHHDLDRVLINMILNGKRPVSGSVAKALGLRKVYVAAGKQKAPTDAGA
jgi:glucokinase